MSVRCPLQPFASCREGCSPQHAREPLSKTGLPSLPSLPSPSVTLPPLWTTNAHKESVLHLFLPRIYLARVALRRLSPTSCTIPRRPVCSPSKSMLALSHPAFPSNLEIIQTHPKLPCPERTWSPFPCIWHSCWQRLQHRLLGCLSD